MAKRAGIGDPRIGQQAFLFAADETKLCNQCWRTYPLTQFVGRSGKITQDCSGCRARSYKGVENHRSGLRTTGEHRVIFMLRSGNRKTGRIPVSITSSETCPPTCRFFNAGCYGESSLLRHHWRGAAQRGLEWDEFCSRVRRLPEGQLWRHNEVGDLPGVGANVDHELTTKLVLANVGRNGFTYTHKIDARNLSLFRWAIDTGFTINVSADNIDQVDWYMQMGLPTTVVVSHTCQVSRLVTPRGRIVIICPATTRDVTCEKCKLCAGGERDFAIGFPAHGIRKTLVSSLVKRSSKLKKA